MWSDYLTGIPQMNPELGADGSGFLGLPGGPTLLVAGRLQSGPGAVFLGPKCWIFLGIWAHSSCRLTLERVTIGRLSRRGRRLRPQLCNQLQNLPEHLPGNGDLGHLEGSAAAVTDDLGADLISFSFRVDSDQSSHGEVQVKGLRFNR